MRNAPLGLVFCKCLLQKCLSEIMKNTELSGVVSLVAKSVNCEWEKIKKHSCGGKVF